MQVRFEYRNDVLRRVPSRPTLRAMIRRLQDQHDLQSSRAENPNFAGTLAKG